jgi:phage-related protein
MEQIRKIIYFKDYFLSFFNDQVERVKEKIDYVLFLITVAERIPKKFFKHLADTDGLYEVRVEFEGNIYRIFCCIDEGKVVVLFNGFQKKSQKTPQAEINKAKKIKEEYFKEKNKIKSNESKK